jgi:hypothetical protein
MSTPTVPTQVNNNVHGRRERGGEERRGGEKRRGGEERRCHHSTQALLFRIMFPHR